MKLLIVDDSATMRKIIMRSIRQSGFKVDKFLEAKNGKEALALIASNPVDAVLTDINMPDMDGLELLKELRSSSDTRDLPVIMITTEGAENVVAKAKRLGLNGFIRKPFTPEVIGATLSNIMG